MTVTIYYTIHCVQNEQSHLNIFQQLLQICTELYNLCIQSDTSDATFCTNASRL